MPNSYKHRAGDRKDGRLLRSLTASDHFKPYLKRDRGASCIFYEEDLDVTEADNCLRQERTGGYQNIGFLHFFIAAYIRCVSMLPGINRFIVGRHIFARNEIEVVLSVKRSTAIEASDTLVKIRFEATDTIFDVYRKINERIDELKTDDGSDTMSDLLDTFSRAPRLLLRIGFLAMRMLDYLGLLPQNWIDRSNYHASLQIIDAGALNISPAYVQTGDFGTLPLTLSFGSKHHVYEMDKTGAVTDTQHIICKASVDGRLVDARYYAQFAGAMRYIFAHPEILEHAPNRLVEDVG